MEILKAMCIIWSLTSLKKNQILMTMTRRDAFKFRTHQCKRNYHFRYQNNKPIFATWFTISSHMPYDYIGTKRSLWITKKMIMSTLSNTLTAA